MLISCPKCHSIYEIPDDLIGKTGRNFRCHACAHLWHAMREDALDYVANEKEEDLYIEPLSVKETERGFPADKSEYKVPADTPSTPEPSKKHAKKTEPEEQITLTSEQGTSFTISTIGDYEDEENGKKAPHLYEQEELNSIRADKENRLTLETKFKGYRKTMALLFIIMLCMLALFLRREIVALYPEAENWYNKIQLSGLNNAEYLKMNIINAIETETNGKKTLTVKVNIENPSIYGTYVPEIIAEGFPETYKAQSNFLSAKTKTEAEIILPKPEDNSPLNISLSFKQPEYNFSISNILERIK